MGNTRSRLDGSSSSGCHGIQSTQEDIQRISDALYKFHEPKSANLDIFFFHGLECECAHISDAHVLTWRSTPETGEKEEIWPQKWLPEDFPHARIISVSYDNCSKQADRTGSMDLYLIGENLVQEIIWARKQCSNRPVILVGHGFGGVVLKKLCVHAHDKKENSVRGMDLDMFLESIRGFVFYATPHLGMEGIEPPGENEGPLLRWMRVLNSESARLHEAFTEIWRRRRYHWTIYGLGEVESTVERHGLRVPEASARFGDEYMTVPGDHFSVCRPSDRKNNKYQFLHTLIEEVQRQIELERRQPMVVPEMTVGVDSLLAELLGKHIQEHSFVGLCGMGGVGKTTLAKLIFNQIYAKFEFSCFVEGIKQITGTRDEVKEKVWKKMLRHGVPVCSASESSGPGEWHQVTGRSLFVIFDDVEDADHVKLLKEMAHKGSQESRFILTSRDMNRLRDCGHDIHICPLDRLEDEDANKLFISYAFPGQKETPESLRRVVKQVVDGCEGLPLTLEVLGNYLRGKEIEHWEEIPRALRECNEVADLEEKVWAKLQLSYDRLPSSEVKYMFLDIASFFVFDDIEFSVDDAILGWTSIYGTGRNRLQTLEDRALIRVIVTGKDLERYDKRFYMHEHLRKMGQRIAKLEGRSFDLSRVRMLSTSNWDPGAEEVHNQYPYDDQVIFQGDQELGKIVAHRIWISRNSMRVCGQTCAFCLMREVWPKLTAIRFMELSIDVSGCCQECKNRGCPLPSTLVLFSLGSYEINVDFVIYGVIGTNFPEHTTGTLVLTKCTSLVKLDLSACNNVDVGGLNKLQHLRILNIHGCREVRNWPTSLRELTNLKRLDLSYIDEPFELPIAFGNLTNLEHLSIQECKVNSVPSSLQNLTSLRVLNVDEIVDRQWIVPDTLGNLTNLETLSFECHIAFLPASVSNLTRLKRLYLEGKFGDMHFEHGNGAVFLNEDAVARPIYPSFHHLQGFMTKQKHLSLYCEQGTSAVIVRNMIGLEWLEIQVSGPEAVPDIFGDLQKLRIFKLECGAVENSLVKSLERLSSLEELELVCRTVEQLPDEFGCFSTVKALRIACPSLQALPDTFGNFIQLTTLEMHPSKDRFWSSIARGDLSPTCQGIIELPDSLGNLTNLEAIGLTWPIECIPASVSSLTRLKRLELEGKFGKVRIADGEGVVRLMEDAVVRPIYPSFHHLQGLMTKQKGLRLDCKHGTSAVIVKNMIRLEWLEIQVSGSEVVPDIFGDLQKLRIFKLECGAVENSLVKSLERLSSLEELVLVCRTVEQLPDVSGCFSTLKALRIKCLSLSCQGIVELSHTLGNLTNLEKLQLEVPIECLSASVSMLTRLKRLDLEGEFGDMCFQHGNGVVFLNEDAVARPIYPSFHHLEGLMTKQKGLSLYCKQGTSAVIVRNMIGLEWLEIQVSGPEAVPDIFGDLQKLRILKLECGAVENSLVKSLERLSSLEEFVLVCRTLERLPDVFGCFSTLKALRITCPALQALPDTFRNFIQLTTLEVNPSEATFWSSIAPGDLSPTYQGIVELSHSLGNLTNLEEIRLTWPIECIPASVSSLTRLKTLQLVGKFGEVRIADGEGVVRLMEDAVARPIYPSFHHLQGLMTKQKGLQLDCQHGTSAVIVRNMIGLERLEIQVSGPEAVPDIFGDLQKLRILKLECGAMENSLVKSLKRLSSLEELDIKVSGPGAVEDKFGDLQKLRIFKLECGAMENSLVDSLERLSSLEKLLLVCRTVEQLPDIFGCFSTLKALRIECPSLQALPDTFGNFIQLTTVRISDSDLRGLPGSFAQLSQLREFRLTGCTALTTTLPEGHSWEIDTLQLQTIWQLPRLKELEISGRYRSEYTRRWDHLQRLLETICQMTHLKSLRLCCLTKLTTLPEALGNMHSLEKLKLLNCAFESLPESLGRLTGLTHLEIRCCVNLKTLPDTIGGLSSLETLVLWNLLNLTTLPETVGNLHSLERLELGGCAIKTLPESLGGLLGLTISWEDIVIT